MKLPKTMNSVIPLEEVVTVSTRDQKPIADHLPPQNGVKEQNRTSARYIAKVTRPSSIINEPTPKPQESIQKVNQDAQVTRTRSGTRSHHPETNGVMAPTSADGIAFKQSTLDAKYPNPYEQKHKEWRSLLAPPAPTPSSNPYSTRTSARKVTPTAATATPSAAAPQKQQPQEPAPKTNGKTDHTSESLMSPAGLLTRSKLKQQSAVAAPQQPVEPPKIRILPGDKFYPLKLKMEVPLPRPNPAKHGAVRKQSLKSASDEDPAVEENSDSEFEAEDVEDEDY